MQMGKRQTALVTRAWRLLRLALLWARKGGLFRRELAPDLRPVPGYRRGLRAAATARSDVILYEEREFSFDETPIFHFKMHRRSMRMPHIPCINPSAFFEGNDDDDHIFFRRDEGLSCLRGGDGANREWVEEEERGDAVVGGGGERPCVVCGDISEGEEEAEEEDKSIDVKAEEFIAKFYQQMKLQRQVSLLQYKEMLLTSSG